MKICYDPNASELTAFLPEKVNAENQQSLYKELCGALDEARTKGTEPFLFLDAGQTEYFSSAGIRLRER